MENRSGHRYSPASSFEGGDSISNSDDQEVEYNDAPKRAKKLSKSEKKANKRLNFVYGNKLKENREKKILKDF